MFDPAVFSTPRTIALAGSELELSSKTTISITGPAAGVTISGNGASRVFAIDADVSASFNGLTITGGQTASAPLGQQYGAGIVNDGTLFLSDCTVSNNDAGIDLGGGIYSDGYLVLTGVTVSDNSAYNGAGLVNLGGKAILINSTLARNVAFEVGGAIEMTQYNGGTTSLFNCTLSGNIAQIGGAVSNGGVLNLANSILAGNSAPAYPDCDGPVNSLGYNLVGVTDGSSGWLATDIVGTMAHPKLARLSALGFNGGRTQTLVPLAGRLAIDHGSNLLVPYGLTTDQRGLARLVGVVDIGSVEVQP